MYYRKGKPFGKQNHREEMHMRTNFYLDGKKTTRKAVKELVGEERMKEMIQEAKETFFEDPNTLRMVDFT